MRLFIISFAICAILITTDVSAQTISSYVISPTGGFHGTNELLISHTTGEMAIVGGVSTREIYLSQGFQQGYLDDFALIGDDDFPVDPVEEPINDDLQTDLTLLPKVYPNPTLGTIFVETNYGQKGEVKYQLFDMIGRNVHSEFSIVEGFNKQILDINQLDWGIYLLKVEYTSEDKKIKISEYTKIELYQL
ncbi:MAG: T9SS type A sorting domain-containing protein [Bacteroidetes bacterium]|nr:T9SS type A sorting domain-containing protein [Bacteroidota bacterium]